MKNEKLYSEVHRLIAEIQSALPDWAKIKSDVSWDNSYSNSRDMAIVILTDAATVRHEEMIKEDGIFKHVSESIAFFILWGTPCDSAVGYEARKSLR